MLRFLKWIRSWFAYFSDRKQFAQFFALSENDFPTLENYSNEIDFVEAVKQWWKEKVNCLDFRKYPESIMQKHMKHLYNLCNNFGSAIEKDMYGIYSAKITPDDDHYDLCIEFDPYKRCMEYLDKVSDLINVFLTSDELSKYNIKDAIHGFNKYQDAFRKSYELGVLSEDQGVDFVSQYNRQEVYDNFMDFAENCTELFSGVGMKVEASRERDADYRHVPIFSIRELTPDEKMQVEGDKQHKEANQAETTPDAKTPDAKIDAYEVQPEYEEEKNKSAEMPI